jgi:integral membrane protein
MIEGTSFLLLMGIAMPLKYFANFPEAVKWTGWAHGLLFILLCAVILLAWVRKRLSIQRAALAFAASLIPFGPFLLDRKLAEDEAREIKNLA